VTALLAAAGAGQREGVLVRVLGIHHIGVGVERLDAVEDLLAKLTGVASERGAAPPGSDLRFGLLGFGPCELELMQPSRADSVVGRFLARRGEGLHHIAFAVDDVRAAMAHASALGLEVLSEQPLPGVNGTLTAFLHPSGTHGMLIEFVQDPNDYT